MANPLGRCRQTLRLKAPSWAWLLVAVPVVFLVLAVIWPLAALLSRVAVVPAEIWTSTDIWRIGLFALGQAGLSTLLTLLVGLPVTYLIARYSFKGKQALSVLLTVPFVLPTVVVALAFSLLLPAGLNYGLFAVLLAHVYLNLAIVYRLVGGVLSQADPRYAQVAQTLGDSSPRANWSFTFRYAAPAVVSAAAIVFVFCFTSLGVVLLLGGRQTPTWELEILRRTTLLVDFDAAVAISILQVMVVTFALSLSFILQRRLRMSIARPKLGHELPALPVRGGVWLRTLLIVTAVLMLLPIARLFQASVTGRDGLTYVWWQTFWSFETGTTRYLEPFTALQTSLLFALATGLVAAVIAMAVSALVIAYPKLAGFSLLLVLPIGLSAVTIGLGLLIAYGARGIDLGAGGVLIVVAHSLIAVPLVVSAVLPSVRSLDSRLRAVAAMLGANPWRAMVTAYGPSIRRTGLLAGGLAAGVSLGEFGAASVLTRVDSATLPLMIARALTRPGEASLGVASVAAVVLVVIVALVVSGIDKMAAK